MINKKLFVLIIEDSEEDAEQNVGYLQKAGYDIHFQRVETENEMKSALENQKWDIILADYLMPRFSVPAALKIYKESDSDIPFIVISGAIGDKKAVTLMKAGAHDYVLKDNMTRFVSAVERELREAAIRQEKRWANQNLQIQHELSLKLNKTSDLKVVLNYVIETIHKVEGIDCSGIYIYNSQKGALELSAYNGLSQDVLKLASYFDAGSPFTRVVREGHPIYGQYTGILQLINAVPHHETFRASAIIPIELDGQSMGAIFCASRTSEDFLFAAKITLESIASQIGGTIARIQSEVALKKKEVNYRLLAENATDVIWMIGLDMKPMFISPSITRLLGYSIEDSMNNTMEKIYTPASFEFAMKALEDELMHDKERDPQRTRIMELELVRKDGSTVIVEGNFTFLRDENGQPSGIMTIIRDITKRKKAEEMQQKSERELKAIINSSVEPIFLMDSKGTILIANEGLGIRFGMEFKKLPGKNIYDLLPPEVAKSRRGKMENVFKTGEPIRFEDERSGRTILNSVFPVSAMDGKITRAAIFSLDITERILTEKRLIHSGHMAGLGELASGIAHEINQPLNTISLIMDNLLSEVAKDENIEEGYLKKKSDKIFENITRMKNIIDHIRAFSRNQDDYISIGFDINSSIRNAVSMISEQFKHLAISLNLDLKEKLPEIIGNTYKIEQVILNLLSNAKDALLEKSHKVTESQSHKVAESFEMVVGIKSYQEDQSIIVEVNDNGIGISEKDIEHIMLPFYTTKNVGKGTGLGLSISSQIIRDMHGTIEISSTILKGTTIKIILRIQNNKVSS